MARTTLEQLYSLSIPEVQDVFLAVMQDVVDRAILDEMIKAIEAGDEEALFRASGFTSAVLSPILDKIEDIYKESADITVDGWPNRIKTPTGLVTFKFDIRNPTVETDLRTFSSDFITRITEETKQNIRRTLEQGMIKGENPRKTALDIIGRVDSKTKKRVGGIIGLTENQQKWIVSTQTYLEQLNSKYFTLTLRDKRFDPIVKKAIENGKPLSSETVTKIITSYKSRALKYRGDMIARTETIQSINRGEYASYVQAINEGVLKRKAITKEWDDVGDLRTRTTHSILGSKYGKNKGIPFEDAFVSPSGARLKFPGDSSLGAPAREIIQCRCKLWYRVNWKLNAED